MTTAVVPESRKRERRKVPLPPVPEHLATDSLLTAREGAAVLRIGLSSFWLRVREGRLPPPVRVSPKSPRWRLRDLHAALEPAT